MNNTQKTIALLLGTATLALTNVNAVDKPEVKESPAKPAPLFPDPVIVKGKRLEIKRSELDNALTNLKATAAAQGQKIPPERINLLEAQVLNDLIGRQLLLNKATDADKAKGREQFEKSFQNYKTQAKVSDAEFEEKLRPQLLVQSLTREQWEKQRVEQSIIGLVLERELKSKITVTDEQVKKYHEENPAQFEEPEKVRASHILIGTRDAATGTELSEEKKKEKKKLTEDILKRAKAGEDFAKLAKEFSEDPGSKDKGGEYTFPRGQMVPEFETTAFALKTNEVSGVVTTQFGYHIIKLSEKMAARKVPLAEVAKEVKEGLTQQEVQKQVPEYFEKLKQEAAVEVLDEKLKAKDTPAAAEKPAGKPPTK